MDVGLSGAPSPEITRYRPSYGFLLATWTPMHSKRPDPPLTFLVVNTGRFLLTGAKRPPATSLCFGDSGSAFCCPGAGRQPAVESAAPLSRHHPPDARGSGSGFGAAPRSEFALQRQSCAR